MSNRILLVDGTSSLLGANGSDHILLARTSLSIVHTKVSLIADDPTALAAGEVLPSDWNDDHAIDGGTPGSVLFVDSDNTITQDNENFFWDDINNLLNIPTIIFSSVEEFADDAAAAVGSVPVGGVYRTASVLKIRVT